MADSYNRNAGLAFDADLALVLRCEAHRLAFVLECGAAQAHLSWNAELAEVRI